MKLLDKPMTRAVKGITQFTGNVQIDIVGMILFLQTYVRQYQSYMVIVQKFCYATKESSIPPSLLNFAESFNQHSST